MKLFLFFLSSVLTQVIIAQLKPDESKNFIINDKGQISYTDKLDIKAKSFKLFLISDSSTSDLKEVKFFKYATNVYGKLPPRQGEGKYAFAQRTKKGKINLYGYISITGGSGGGGSSGFQHSYTGGVGGMNYINSSTGGKASTSVKKQYYNKGFGDLIPAKYKNLKIDLADNTKSMEYLNKYRKLNILSRTFYTSGTLVGIGSILYFLNKKKDNPDYESEALLYSTIGVSLSCYVTGTLLEIKKDRQLNGAIDAYNQW